MASFTSSLDEFDHLYSELAKQAVPCDYLTVADVLGMHLNRKGITAPISLLRLHDY